MTRMWRLTRAELRSFWQGGARGRRWGRFRDQGRLAWRRGRWEAGGWRPGNRWRRPGRQSRHQRRCFARHQSQIWKDIVSPIPPTASGCSARFPRSILTQSPLLTRLPPSSASLVPNPVPVIVRFNSWNCLVRLPNVNVEVAMREKGLGCILRELAGDHQAESSTNVNAFTDSFYLDYMTVVKSHRIAYQLCCCNSYRHLPMMSTLKWGRSTRPARTNLLCAGRRAFRRANLDSQNHFWMRMIRGFALTFTLFFNDPDFVSLLTGNSAVWDRLGFSGESGDNWHSP